MTTKSWIYQQKHSICHQKCKKKYFYEERHFENNYCEIQFIIILLDKCEKFCQLFCNNFRSICGDKNITYNNELFLFTHRI